MSPRTYSASPASLHSIPESDLPSLEGSALDTDDDNSQLASPVSSRSTSSLSLATSIDTHSSISYASTSSSSRPHIHFDLYNHALRPNEHMAVLLEKHLWKPDSYAQRCEIIHCRKPFSVLERKHHCRKCGGIFCRDCSSRRTPLLDVKNLDFLLPPRGVSIAEYHSATSPVMDARVCDNCYEHLHGETVPRSPRVEQSRLTAALKHSTAEFSATLKRTSSPSSSITSLDHTEQSNSTANAMRPALRRAQTSPPTPSSIYSANPQRHPPSGRSITSSMGSDSHSVAPMSPTKEWNSLKDYPLCEPSAVCRAKGGGRWEPVPQPMWDGYRPPFGKAQYEIEMEKEEENRRLEKANPIIKDGVFKMRKPQPYEPLYAISKPVVFSTF